jgi:hypothetical protein
LLLETCNWLDGVFKGQGYNDIELTDRALQENKQTEHKLHNTRSTQEFQCS